MNDPNPYRSPEAVVADLSADDSLASRGARLGASLIDGVIMFGILMPLMYVGGYWRAAMDAAASGGQPQIGTVLLWALIGFAVFAAVQFVPLNATGQTWGKKILGIRIADLEGGKPPIGRLLGMRYLPVHAVSNIPFIGPLAVLVDILLIFREDRRCAHDLIAGTRVVNAK